ELELGAWAAETRYLLGDGTGDGKADLWVVSQTTDKRVQVVLWLSDGKTFTAGTPVTSSYGWQSNHQYILSDIKRNGRQALSIQFLYAGSDYVYVFFHDDDGVLKHIHQNHGAPGKTSQYLKVDIQGDGRDDWVEVYQDAEGVEHLRNAVSHGNASWNWA
ncbi:hypothetical protein ACUHMQ_21050, partial [Chitinimonas sp. PSY-7]|uniref:hypothetical protein n=1 Tax=Chitinimonas sp. PSY-7 TaxID=3459088 RepID=UPI00403FCE23